MNSKDYRFLLLSAIILLALPLSVQAAIVVPTNVIAYVPIPITNPGAKALNPSQAIPIAVNMLAYQQYYISNAGTSNAINAEFFWANGTIIPSWLEAFNSLNENVSTDNHLTQNGLYWIRDPYANFHFPVSGTNTVYLGWAGNVLTTSNTLMSYPTTGEVSQLAPNNAIDNGASIFQYYYNFANTLLLGTLPSGWSAISPATKVLTPTNVIVKSASQYFGLSDAAPAFLVNASSYMPAGNTIDVLATMPSTGGGSAGGWFGLSTDSAMSAGTYVIAEAGQVNSAGGLRAGVTGVVVTIGAGRYPTPSVWSIAANGLSGTTYSATYMVNRALVGSIAETSTLSLNGKFFILPTSNNTAGTSYYWVRGYYSLPNNGLTPPTTTYGTVNTVVISDLGIPTIAASNTLIDEGQYETLTATWTGTATPFTVKFFNETAGSTFNTIGGTTSPATNTFKLVSAASAGRTWNAVVTDSATSPGTKNSVDLAIGVNTALAIPSITGNTLYDSGQVVVLTSSGTTSGTSNYQIKFFNETAGSTFNTIGGLSTFVASNSFTASATTQTRNTWNGLVTDSAAIPVTTNSVDFVFGTNAVLASGSITPVSPVIFNGQNTTLTASWTGGTSTYSVQWFDGSSSACASDTNSIITHSGVGGLSDSLSVSPSTGVKYYCAKVTDSASLPTITTVGSDMVTINSFPACGTTPVQFPVAVCERMTFTTGNAIAANTSIFIPFNSGAVSPYISTTANNFVIYNGFSATTANIFIVGNIANTIQTTGLNTANVLGIWMNMPDSFSSTDTNWFIGMASTSTDAFISGNGVHEAPQLSGAYGKYTGGIGTSNPTFPILFENLSGSSAPSGYTATAGASINNGALISGVTNSLYSTATYPAGNIFVAQSSVPSQTGVLTTSGGGWCSKQSSGTGNCGGTTANAIGWGGSSPSWKGYVLTSGSGSASTSSLPEPVSNVMLMSYWNGGTSYFDYGANIPTVASPSVASSTTPSTEYVNFWSDGASSTGGQYIQYFFIAQAPPSGIMPKISLGALGVLPSVSVAPSSGAYPATSMVTATCIPSSDTCAVQAPVGTNLAVNAVGNPGSAVYNIPVKAVGVYSYYGNDLTANANSIASTWTVNTNSSQLLSCNYNGHSIVGSGVYNVLFANTITTCAIGSYHTQVTTGNLIEGSTIRASGASLTTNQLWDNQVNSWVANTLANANYSASSLSWSENDTSYIIGVNTLPGPNGYETQTQTFTYTINFTKAANQFNLFLKQNTANVVNSITSVTSVAQSPSLQYILPLAAVNNIAYTYNDFAILNFSGNFISYNPVVTPTLNTMTQNTIQDYYPVEIAQQSNTILGENQTIYFNVTDLGGLGRATVAISSLLGNLGNIPAQSFSGYKYFTNLNSFIPSNFGIANPVAVGSELIPINTIIQLTYGSSTAYRNQSTSFISTNQSVGSCTTFSTNAIGWSFYVLPTISQYTGNVNLAGSFTISKNKYASPIIQGNNAGLASSGTTDVFATCMYPSWATTPINSFNLNGQFSYYASNYPTPNTYFLLNQTVQGATVPVHLYFSNLTNPILYTLVVQNLSSNYYQPALIQVEEFIPNNNSYVPFTELQTPAGGSAQTYLGFGSKYKFVVYSLTGQLLNSTSPYVVQSCQTQPCFHAIQIGNINLNTVGTSLGKVNYPPCGLSYHNVTNVTYNATLTCSFSSSGGASYNATLNVTSNFLGGAACLKNVVGASGSLSCTVSNVNNTQYDWQFGFLIGNERITAQSGIFGHQSALFGGTGVLVTMILVLGLALLYMTKSWIASIVLSDVALIGASIMGLIVIPTEIIGALQVFVAITIWLVARP